MEIKGDEMVMNIGDVVRFNARVPAVGRGIALAVVHPLGERTGKVTAVYPNRRFPQWEIEADVMDSRGRKWCILV